MRRVWLIAGHEFRTTVRRFGYLFVSFGLPLVGLGIGALVYVTTRESMETHRAERSKAGVVDLGDFLTLDPPDDVRRYDTESEALEAFVAGEINTYVLINRDFLKNGRVEVKSKVKQTFFDLEKGGVPKNVKNYLRDQVLVVVEDLDRRARIKTLITDAKPVLLDEQGEVSSEEQFKLERLVVALVFFLALFMAVSMSGTYLLQGLADEKENRVMEMVLTSVRAEELMWGKLLGLGAAGMLQLVIWGVMGITGLLIFAVQVLLDPRAVLVCVPLFVLGYLLMGSLMLGTGSIGTNLREVTQWSMVWSMLSILPLFMMNPILADPHGAIARGLTFFPITTAPMLMLRYALDADGVALWEMLLGYGILIVSTYLALKAAAKIYKVGLLLYGKRPTPRQIFRWLFT